MIHTFAVTHQSAIEQDLGLERLHSPEIRWYWVDFDCPTSEEAALLDTFFHFHPLAIEDCMQFLQRPKLDHYEDHHFFVLHTINPVTLDSDEVDLFLGRNYIVTYHSKPQSELEDFRGKLLSDPKYLENGPVYASHLLIDKIVDQYFPSVYHLEDSLNELEDSSRGVWSEKVMDRVFEIRSDLLKLRKTIFPMRDLLYRIIYSEKIEGVKQHAAYFQDIHDHLLKLSDMVEANRDLTSDIRDSFISINSYRMNTIMKTLTVITTIFMPLTFIAGIYGMNFRYMPELEWSFGYFAVLFIMFSIGLGMFWWFKVKGWFK
ncbi:magnesium/cobalt transporter CorA [Paenibacillus naphthalenovorans]|uniref:magnesium/cobalt transporter CorA n=1 Tax=Paenibacillus naphthalenovorans TaxID=162209 RepID=UPI003D2BA9EB